MTVCLGSKDHPPLNLVDLPGLIPNTADASSSDVELMVKDTLQVRPIFWQSHIPRTGTLNALRSDMELMVKDTHKVRPTFLQSKVSYTWAPKCVRQRCGSHGQGHPPGEHPQAAMQAFAYLDPRMCPAATLSAWSRTLSRWAPLAATQDLAHLDPEHIWAASRSCAHSPARVGIGCGSGCRLPLSCNRLTIAQAHAQSNATLRHQCEPRPRRQPACAPANRNSSNLQPLPQPLVR